MNKPKRFAVRNYKELEDEISNLEEQYGFNFFVLYEVRPGGKIKGVIVWEEDMPS